MFFGGVIKISKFQKTRFSSYFEVVIKSNSYRVPCSYKAFGGNSVHENLFTRFTSTGWHIFLSQKDSFSWSWRLLDVSKVGPTRLKKIEFLRNVNLWPLALLVFNETLCVQVGTHYVYYHRITRLQPVLFKNKQIACTVHIHYEFALYCFWNNFW